jgi:hypothetical protein
VQENKKTSLFVMRQRPSKSKNRKKRIFNRTYFNKNRSTVVTLMKISNESHHPLVRALAGYFAVRGVTLCE